MPDTLKLFKQWLIEHAKNQCQSCNDIYFGFVGGYRMARKQRETRLMQLERENEKLHKIIKEISNERSSIL